MTQANQRDQGPYRQGYPYKDHPRWDVGRMIPPDGKVIGSIGCGSGATEAALVQAGREVHGVDIMPEPIERARTRLTSARVVQAGDVHHFEPASLDGLILADVIEHLPEAWNTLKVFATFVKPGGWVLISVPNMLYIGAMKQYLWRRDWPEVREGIFDQTHIQFMTRRRLIRWCEAADIPIAQWFDKRGLSKGWQRAIAKAVNLATLKRFDEMLEIQLQVICRRRA
jgi:2-polyprenyl-3-methyl-5-hydroxy-6-metoxy-1,4-benzoquinol methylase